MPFVANGLGLKFFQIKSKKHFLLLPNNSTPEHFAEVILIYR